MIRQGLRFWVVQRFRVRVRTRFRAVRWNEAIQNRAPEGRPNLAQRFSAGENGRNDSSPGGTTEFSRTLFSAAIRSTLMSLALAVEATETACSAIRVTTKRALTLTAAFIAFLLCTLATPARATNAPDDV